MSKTVYYENEKDLQGLKWAAKTLDFGVGLELSATFNEMRSAYVMLMPRKDLFRHKVKMYARKAMDAIDHREAEIKETMIDKKFWYEYSDSVIDFAQTDITRFRISIKQVMDNVGFRDSELIANVETARVLAEMCIQQYDIVIEDGRKKFGKDYSASFPEYRITKIFHLWQLMCDELYKGVSIDLNTPETSAMFDIMCRKFANGDYIDSCLKEAQKTNPDFENAVIVREEE